MAICTTTLPAFHADICTDNVHFGPVDVVLFSRYGDNFTDSTDDAEWVARLSNSTALPSPGTDAPVRYLFGIGSIGAAESTDTPISIGRTKASDPKTSFVFAVDDTGTTNAAAFASRTQGTYAIWLLADGQLYGGDTGIKATLKFGSRLIPDSDTAIQTFELTVSFNSALPAPADGNFLYTLLGAE